MMETGKINIGKGLLRLYLVLWMLLVMASLVGGHQEVMTYLGSTYWSEERVAQRKKEEFERKKKDCKSEECRMRWENIDYLNLDLVEGPKSNYQDIAKERVEVSAFFVLVVPGVLLLVLAVIFKLLAWAVAGFKPK